DGNDRCRLLYCEDGECICDNDVDLEADKLGCDLSVARGTSLRPAILDRDGATFNPAEFTQSLHKSSSPGTPDRSVRAQEPDRRQLPRLLRACRQRPRRRAADERDELSSPHSITSSAATSRPGGTASPSAFAVFKLSVVSYLVGACTGRSAGAAPR